MGSRKKRWKKDETLKEKENEEEAIGAVGRRFIFQMNSMYCLLSVRTENFPSDNSERPLLFVSFTYPSS